MTPGETSYMSNCSAKVILPDLPSSVAGLYVRFFPLPESYMRHSPELYLHPCKRWRRYASAYKLGQTTQPPASVRNSTGLPARRVPGLRSTAGTLVLHCCWLVHGLGLYTASNRRFEGPASGCRQTLQSRHPGAGPPAAEILPLPRAGCYPRAQGASPPTVNIRQHSDWQDEPALLGWQAEPALSLSRTAVNISQTSRPSRP